MGVDVRDELVWAGKALHADVEREGDRIALDLTLARRETAVSLRRLRYRITLEVESEEETVYFSETLWEEGPRDEGAVELAPRLTGKEDTFRVETVHGGSGGLEEHVALFERRYGTTFDFTGVRHRLKEACERAGYELRRLVPV